MGSFSIWHWLLVLVIIALVFGTKKLKSLGADLGEAVKGFKNAINRDEEESVKTSSNNPSVENK